MQRALLQQAPPLLDLLLDVLAPRAVLLALEQRVELGQRLPRVADHRALHRIADREHAPVEVDLHAARLARFREPFGVREARPDHEERVALVHQFPARLGAEQADRAGDEREVVRNHRAPKQRLRHTRAQQQRGQERQQGGKDAVPRG